MRYSQEAYMMARDVAENLADKNQLIYLMWQGDNYDLTILDWSTMPACSEAYAYVNKTIKDCFVPSPRLFDKEGSGDAHHDFGHLIVELVEAHYDKDAELLIEAAREQLEFDKSHDETLRWMGEDRV